MTRIQTTVSKAASMTGSAMMIAWFLFLGPAGFLVLLGVAYSMVAPNLLVGILCGLLLLTPVVLTAAWLPLGWYALLRKQGSEATDAVPDAELATQAMVAD